MRFALLIGLMTLTVPFAGSTATGEDAPSIRPWDDVQRESGAFSHPWPKRLRGRARLLAKSPPLKISHEMRLRFHGRIDGSETIEITSSGATWGNVHWGISNTTVKLNDVAWAPRADKHLLNSGPTAFLSPQADLSTARLVGQPTGRDTVALIASADKLTIRIADNPIGADTYAFVVKFDRIPPSYVLNIRARIDGSDAIVISSDAAVWTHLHWGWPREVRFNERSWDPHRTPRLANAGLTRFLPDGIDFRSARVVETKGRDLAAIECHNDHLVVRFVDTPNGGADYALRIRFGMRAR